MKIEKTSANPHAGHRKRLRARFENGDALTEAELLELLLFYCVPRVDTRPMAESLLETFGCIEQVLAATKEERRLAAALPDAADILFALINDIHRQREITEQTAVFTSDAFLLQYLPRRFCGFQKERAELFFLDSAGILLHRKTIYSNDRNYVQLSPDHFLVPAAEHHAEVIILAHNHPNGKAIPSSADLYATASIYRLLERNGLLLAEHYVVAGDSCAKILQDSLYAHPMPDGLPEEISFM